MFVGLKERQERKWRRCYVTIILNYGAYLGDCKARPGMLFSCAKSRPVARTMMLMMIVMAVADVDSGDGDDDVRQARCN